MKPCCSNIRRYLALMEWAAGIKLLVFLTLLVNVCLAPLGIATEATLISPGDWRVAVHVAKAMGLAVIGVIESMFARSCGCFCAELLGSRFHPGAAGLGVLLHVARVARRSESTRLGSQLVDLCSGVAVVELFRHRGAAAALGVRRSVLRTIVPFGDHGGARRLP